MFQFQAVHGEILRVLEQDQELNGGDFPQLMSEAFELPLGAGFVLEFIRHRQNRIGINKTLVVIQDDLKLTGSIHSAFPTVPTKIVGNAVQGIGLCKEIDPAIIVGVYSVG